MWVIVQSASSILLVACKAAVPALQVDEVERGVIRTALHARVLSFIKSRLFPVHHNHFSVVVLEAFPRHF
jgi:hypothetical protein